MIRLHRPKGLPMSRIARLVLAFVLVGFSVNLLVEPQSLLAQQKPKLRPLRIALPSHTIAATHFYVGKSLGIFESHGFEPQILVLEPRAALRGVPVRVIMVGLNRPDHVLVASKEITSVEQLRGKVLGGYTAQATVNTILIELLRRRGLKPDEYKILNVGTARLCGANCRQRTGGRAQRPGNGPCVKTRLSRARQSSRRHRAVHGRPRDLRVQ